MYMDKKDIILNLFKSCADFYFEKEDDIYRQKMIFLTNHIIGYTTYDDDLSEEIGKAIVEVINIIKEDKNFEYTKDSSNYKKFIFVTNLIQSMLDWGTSIRGCWLASYRSLYIDESLTNIGCTEYKDFIPLDKEFLDWFIKWLNSKEI